MYIIPYKYDFKELIGSSLTKVSFILTRIHIQFYGETNVLFHLFGPFEVVNGDKIIECETAYEIKDDYGLVQLIDKKVIDVNIDKDRVVLSITFEGNIVLNLISSDYYESFIIYMDNEEIIV